MSPSYFSHKHATKSCSVCEFDTLRYVGEERRCVEEEAEMSPANEKGNESEGGQREGESGLKRRRTRVDGKDEKRREMDPAKWLHSNWPS